MTTIPARGRLSRREERIPRPNAGIWPGLDTPPAARAKGYIAEQVFKQAIRKLPVRVILADGRRWGAGGPDAPVMRILRPKNFFARLGADAKIGFGEAYMVGDWDTTTLAELLTPFAEQLSSLVPQFLQPLRHVAERRQPKAERNTIEGSRENIGRHYDLSNDLFAAFLDPSMMYSAALFEPGDTLEQAQRRKLDGILDYAHVGPDSHVLEIGTGWGSLAIQAAQRGARVTTLTISQEQADLAQRRIAEAGVADRVQVLLRDYREAQGEYDAVVSVEMIEAVGPQYWKTYFAKLDQLTKPGGRVALQAITMQHERMMATRGSYTWIHKYIFPGGMIPSVRSIGANVADTSLKIVDQRSFGLDYAETLRQWGESFLANWSEIEGYGFDGTFKRMWEFYLGYCEAGFRAGHLDVYQFGMAR
ncbi:class I SAM-dependent methyltransferase [Pseudonocardiaceae bacterium YIM PH 21723]|nr:class I SAM-dependent methyltransferase [Pseudonocardiaceae bacterium YIM PH 21723]